MSKLVLKPAPTFALNVAVPVPGGDFVVVQFTAKFRAKDDLLAFMKSAATAEDHETFLGIVEGWDLEGAPFNRENALQLLQSYVGTPVATYRAYVAESTKSSQGN